MTFLEVYTPILTTVLQIKPVSIMCFNKLTWCDSANMSRLTKMERTGCDAQTTVQMRPANQHLCEKWFTFLHKSKIPTASRKRYLTPHTYSRGALQQILQVAAMKIKRIALDMNESRSVTRPTGHMGILRCLCCFQGEVWWGGAVSPLGDVALPSQPARLCKCAVLSGALCYSWNAGLYLWKISWANCWICVRL